MDLQVELTPLSTEERFAKAEATVSPQYRAKVESARDRQIKRYHGKGIPCNAAIPADQVKVFCLFSPAGFERYKQSVTSHTLSTRSIDRLAKVARTVADLADSATVEPPHVAKAEQFVLGSILSAN